MRSLVRSLWAVLLSGLLLACECYEFECMIFVFFCFVLYAHIDKYIIELYTLYIIYIYVHFVSISVPLYIVFVLGYMYTILL